MLNAMSKNASAQNRFWWQGSLMIIKARAADTAGALGITEGHFPEASVRRCTSITGKTRPYTCSKAECAFARATRNSLPVRARLFGDRAAFRTHLRSNPAAHGHWSSLRPVEEMFAVGGRPAEGVAQPPAVQYDPAAAAALAERFGFEVIGPQLD
jgi:hypothetical protein